MLGLPFADRVENQIEECQANTHSEVLLYRRVPRPNEGAYQGYLGQGHALEGRGFRKNQRIKAAAGLVPGSACCVTLVNSLAFSVLVSPVCTLAEMVPMPDVRSFWESFLGQRRPAEGLQGVKLLLLTLPLHTDKPPPSEKHL